MGKTDELSRKLDWKIEIEKDNENQTLIKEEQIFSLAKVVIERLKVDILEKIKQLEEKIKKLLEQ